MSVAPQEYVPDECVVNRNIFWPNMYDAGVMDKRGRFSFQYKNNKRVESVIWRKYKPRLESVHALGCAKQYEDNRNRQGKKPRQYKGTIDGEVRDIRGITCLGGHTVEVIHEPSEGTHHAHLQIALNGQTDIPKINKNEFNDLRDELTKVFSELREHTCPESEH